MGANQEEQEPNETVGLMTGARRKPEMMARIYACEKMQHGVSLKFRVVMN